MSSTVSQGFSSDRLRFVRSGSQIVEFGHDGTIIVIVSLNVVLHEVISQTLEGRGGRLALNYNYLEVGIITYCLTEIVVFVRSEAACGLLKSLGDLDGVLLAVNRNTFQFDFLSGC